MILVNGEETVSVNVKDRGFQYGDGLFETIAVKEGKPLLWAEHMARLKTGCERLGIPHVEERIWQEDLARILDSSPRQVLKLVLSRGIGERGYMHPYPIVPTRVCSTSAWPEYLASYLQKGIRIIQCKTPVSENTALAGLKHLNRLENVLARAEWHEPDIVEGLLTDSQARIVEGTMSNVFSVQNGELQTPLLDVAGVAGVMRAKVMEFAQKLGIPHKETRLTRASVEHASELFVCNSVIGVLPVSYFEDRSYPGSLNPQGITQTLLKALQEAGCIA
ncbi:MAG: aminodeoxychorismate lyase [Gammaproteobacteria bacterium]|nr:aminodeoxychorismate lyase [Gammaproteobacteria bacterium]MDH5694434.1 aminodeoxychorismate lyase [Gammaproteobacteria bacterium]